MFLTRNGFGSLCGVMVAIAMLVGCESTTTSPNNSTDGGTDNTENLDISTDPRVYWLKEEGDRLALAPENNTSVGDTASDQITKLFDDLLEPAIAEDVVTVIPEGTTLIDLQIQPDGIVVNLSEEFEAGGGSASMVGRVAQVLYTATSTDPSAEVWLQIEGEPLELLGGEGLEIAQPITRAIFEEEFEL